MAIRVESRREQQGNDGQFAGWRGIVSAWVLILAFLMLLAGVHAVASLRGVPHPDEHLAGAVIPRHDTACGGPGITSAHAVAGCEVTPLSEDRSAYW